MCYIGSKNKFVAKHDIIVYKKLSEVSKGKWVTSTMECPIEFNKVLTPEGVVREERCGRYSYKIGEGAIHAYTFSPYFDEKACEKFFIAKIPAGTIFWLRYDLREVAAKKMIITTEHPKPREKTDLSDYYHLGVDVYLKNGSRAKNNGSFSVSDVIGLFAFDNMVISAKVEKEVISHGVVADPKNRYQYISSIETAMRDMDGYTNTKSLEKHLLNRPAINICKKLGEDWYLPALGELIKAFSNLLYINLTLRKLNLPTIYSGTFWSSTMKENHRAWIKWGDMDVCEWYHFDYVRCWNYVLPFLEH